MSEHNQPEITIEIKGDTWTYSDETMILTTSTTNDKEFILMKLQNTIKQNNKHDV